MPVFRIVLRGYDPQEVDTYIEELKTELAAVRASSSGYIDVRQLRATISQLQRDLDNMSRAADDLQGPMVQNPKDLR